MVHHRIECEFIDVVKEHRHYSRHDPVAVLQDTTHNPPLPETPCHVVFNLIARLEQ